jgi:putative Mg2+ transporter-C (MgtC) family protein
MPNDFFDINDLYKALFSVGAGIILGLERELKDKKAGLKTISIICLGATLFAIISKKVGGETNAGQIAAYIVSGVGFIGAGAIFKDGFTISGLTTAGIIWLAAAVGTSIGFGEFYTAGIFLVSSFVAIIAIPTIVNLFTAKNEMRQITISLPHNENYSNETELLKDMKGYCHYLQVKKYEKLDNKILLHIELFMDKKRTKNFLQWLHNHPQIIGFNISMG